MTTEDYNLKHGLFDDLRQDYPIVGRKEEMNRLENFIIKKSVGSRTFLIIGDYGLGKTLLLNKIKEKFNDKKFQDAKKTLVIPMRLVEGEPETKIGHSIVTRAFRNIGYSKMYEIVSKSSNLDERLVDANFQKIINGIRDKKRIAYDWMCGHSLPDKDKRDLGISRNLLTSADALQVFHNFLKFLKHAEIEDVYLLIDEFEYVVTVYNQKQIDAILYFFKDIYDKYGDTPDSLAKTIFIIAMTPGCWDFLTNMEERKGGGGIIPWMDRVNPKINKIELLPLSEKETESLLMQRIDKNRTTHAGKLPNKAWPFVSPEFFKIIYEKSGGKPRKSLKYCDHVFDCGIQENVAEFDGEYTTKILEQF
jgi:hypothetical protein